MKVRQTMRCYGEDESEGKNECDGEIYNRVRVKASVSIRMGGFNG